jgi:hypothetical protein
LRKPGADFEADAGGAVEVEDETSVPEHPVDEVRGSTVERDDLDRATEEALQFGFDGELGCAERRRRFRGEQDSYFDVAVRTCLSASDAAEQVDGQGSPSVGLEEGLQAEFDGGRVHGPMILSRA